jgi:hypothetical protein
MHAAMACVGTNIWHAVVTGANAAAMAAGWGRALEGAGGDIWTYHQGRADEELAQAALLREIIGNPFRPITLGRDLRMANIVSLAQAAYDDRLLPGGELDPARLAVLADALEEAGAVGEVLEHLRGPGPHVRGFWPVDACLLHS